MLALGSKNSSGNMQNGIMPSYKITRTEETPSKITKV